MDVIAVNKSNINKKVKDHYHKSKEMKKDYEKRNKKQNTVEYGEGGIEYMN